MSEVINNMKTRRSIRKLEEKIKALEGKENSTEKLQKLKSLGVFMKTYNMAHLLVTRYSIKEDFGVNKSLEKIDGLESQMKETKAQMQKAQNDKAKVEELQRRK